MGFRKRERLLILGAAICVALLLGDRLVVSPLANLWKERADRIAILQKDLARTELLLEREEDIRDRWNEMRSRSLPASQAEAERVTLDAIASWSRSSGLQVSSIRPQWRAEEKGGERRVDFRLSADGGLGQIARFLYELERDNTPARVEDLDITSRDDNGRMLGVDIRFSAICLEEEKS